MGDDWHWMWIRKRIEENWDEWIMAVKNMTSKLSIDRLFKASQKGTATIKQTLKMYLGFPIFILSGLILFQRDKFSNYSVSFVRFG